jgi:hypothetical protein
VTFAVAALSELLSITLPEIVVVFEIVVPDPTAGLTVTTIVIEPLAPEASDGFVQVTVPLAPTAGVVQLQPAGAKIDVNAVPAGRRSVTETFGAGLGPDALKPIVYVRLLPATTGFGAAFFVIARFEIDCAVTLALALSFALTLSTTSPLMLAVFVMTVPGVTEVSTVAPIVIVPLAPGASGLIEQVTVPFVPTDGVLQLHPDAETELKRMPAGRTSVIVVFALSLGPLAE